MRPVTRQTRPITKRQVPVDPAKLAARLAKVEKQFFWFRLAVMALFILHEIDKHRLMEILK